MTNNTNAARTAPTTDEEITMYQLPGHTLHRVTFDAEWLIEGDRVVGPFGNVFAPLVDTIEMSPVWIIVVDAEGARVSFRSPIDSNAQPRVTVLRNVPLTDD